MKTFTIQEVQNGFKIAIDENIDHTEYVYRSVDVLQMLEFVGREVYGKRVKVEER